MSMMPKIDAETRCAELAKALKQMTYEDMSVEWHCSVSLEERFPIIVVEAVVPWLSGLPDDYKLFVARFNPHIFYTLTTAGLAARVPSMFAGAVYRHIEDRLRINGKKLL